MENISKNDVLLFSFKNFHHGKIPCKVIRVIDGDTVHIVFEHLGQYIRLNCRLAGIDAPEMTKDHITSRRSRNRLIQLCTNCEINVDDTEINKSTIEMLVDKNKMLIFVEFYGNDKFGRELVNLYARDGLCINTQLVNEGYAKEYDGGHK